MGEESLSAALMRHVRELSEAIGPRPPCSESEKRASRYIASELEKAGLKPEIQPFKSVKTFSWTHGIIYLIIAASAAIYRFSPYAGFLVCLAAAFAFLGETNANEVVSRLLPKGKSQNVYALLGSKNAGIKVIVSAHYDSSRSGLMFSPKFVKSFRRSFVILCSSLAAMVALYGAGAVAFLRATHPLAWRIPLYASLPFAAYVVFSLGLIIQREAFGKHVKGANDNASGTAVLLELAKFFANNPPRRTDVLFLFTGCEEAGTFGMIRFLDQFKEELSGALLINIDNVGYGSLKYITKEGITFSYPSSPALLKIARAIAETSPDLGFEPSEYRALTTDALPAMTKGFQAMTIMSLADGVPSNWHWPSDTIENVSEKNLIKTLDFVKELVTRLDASAT